MQHLIAILRSALSDDDKTARLQLALGVTAYEAGAHAKVAPPRIVTSRPTQEDAHALAAKLSADGFTAIAFAAPDDVFSDAKRFIARTVRVHDDGVDAVDKKGAHAALPWADVHAILVGVRKSGHAFCDLVDPTGKILCARETETHFEATGGRAGALQLGQTARAKSNGRFDDRLMKPANVASIMGAFASSPHADDVSAWLLWRAVTQG